MVALKYIEYGVYGDLIIIQPQPYSTCVREHRIFLVVLYSSAHGRSEISASFG